MEENGYKGGKTFRFGVSEILASLCYNCYIFYAFFSTETTFRHAHSASEEGVDGDEDDDDDDDEMFEQDDIDLFDEKVRRGMKLRFLFYMTVSCYIFSSSTRTIMTLCL